MSEISIHDKSNEQIVRDVDKRNNDRKERNIKHTRGEVEYAAKHNFNQIFNIKSYSMGVSFCQVCHKKVTTSDDRICDDCREKN